MNHIFQCAVQFIELIYPLYYPNMGESYSNIRIKKYSNTSLAAKGALTRCLQFLTACNSSLPAMPHHLKRRTACNAALPAMLHCLQRLILYKAAPSAKPHYIQRTKKVVNPSSLAVSRILGWQKDFAKLSKAPAPAGWLS